MLQFAHITGPVVGQQSPGSMFGKFQCLFVVFVAVFCKIKAGKFKYIVSALTQGGVITSYSIHYTKLYDAVVVTAASLF